MFFVKFIKTLALWHPAAFGDFREKNTETHVAFSREFLRYTLQTQSKSQKIQQVF